MIKNKCFVCNYDDLYENPYRDGIPSDEICPCCGFHYGYDDIDETAYEGWRKKWISDGCKWFSKSRTAPLNWDVKKQLSNFIE